MLLLTTCYVLLLSTAHYVLLTTCAPAPTPTPTPLATPALISAPTNAATAARTKYYAPRTYLLLATCIIDCFCYPLTAGATKYHVLALLVTTKYYPLTAGAIPKGLKAQ